MSEPREGHDLDARHAVRGEAHEAGDVEGEVAGEVAGAVEGEVVDQTEPPDERPTEWFSIDAGWLDEVEGEPAVTRREHHVTAIVVSHDGEVWLPATLTTLAAQTRPVDGVVGVDTGSSDASAARLLSSLGEERILELPSGTGFGSAAAQGLEHIDRMVLRPEGGFPDAPIIEWLWLLHDDSAPDPGCLDALLLTADAHPSASIIGPKVLGWHDRRLLLEVGFSVTGSGRRFTGLERGEHDQGQHDGVRDVMAVGSAGMLVRRDTWERLSGFDPSLPLFRDDLDFCWRAHRAGERVIVATDAVVHHREASAHGRRLGQRRRPHRLDREAAAHVLLAHAPSVLAPLIAVRLLLGSAITALVYVLGKDIAAARDEVGAVWAVARHPGSLAGSRRLAQRTSTEPASVVRHLRPSAWSQLRHAIEAATGVATTSGATASASVSGLDAGPVDDESEFLETGGGGWLRRALWRPSVLVVLLLTLFAITALRGLWWGDGVLQGGALLPSPEGAADLWRSYTDAWHDVGAGSSAPSAPYLMIVWSLAAVLLGKAPVAVSVIMLLGVPLVGWSAYLALRGIVSSRWVRAWAGAAYALLPAVTGAVSSGRVGTIIAAFVLPFAVRSLVRISREQGTFRRAAGTALLLATAMAAVPATWLIALVVVVGVAVNGWRRAGRAAIPLLRRLALAILAPLVLLAPWSLRLITEPSLFLLEPGVTSPSLDDAGITALDVLLLHPGGPGMTPLWVSIGIVLAGSLALLRGDRFRIIAIALSVGALGLALGTVQTVLFVTPPDATTALRAWPGPATLVLGAAFIAAAAIAADGLRDRFAGANFSLGQPLAAILAVLALAAPVLSALLWFPDAPGRLVRGPAQVVPAFVAADAIGPQAPRTLVLRQDRSGRVLYSLVNGAGPLLGDGDVASDAAITARLDPLVADLASGRGGEEVPALAGFGVRYVLVVSGTSADLIPVLDSAPGLRRLATSGGEILWRVAGDTSRARSLSGDTTSPVGVVRVDGGLSVDPYLDQSIAAPGVLVLGATTDGAWQASAVAADGTQVPLEPTTAPEPLSWSQAFEVPAAGTVRVDIDRSQRTAWLWLQAIVLFVLVVLALPARRREEDFDRDVSDGGDQPESDAAPVAAPVAASDAGVDDPVEQTTDATAPSRPGNVRIVP